MRKRSQVQKAGVCLALSLLCVGGTVLPYAGVRAAESGWQTIDGARYYYTQCDGKMAAGQFVTWCGSRYYLGTDGRLVTDRQDYLIDGVRYNIDKDGRVTAADKCMVVLCDDLGNVLKRTSVKKGSDYVLPSIRNSAEATFIGWSLSAGKHFSVSLPEHVDFETAEYVTVNENIKLYAAVFRHLEDVDLPQSDITRPSENLGGIIFCGDSRQDYTRFATRHYQMETGNVYFVAKGGSGLSWFIEYGSQELLSCIMEIRKSTDAPIAVVMNHGINDLRSPGIKTEGYVPYMNELAAVLKNLGCTLYYMSVLPGNAEQLCYVKGKDVRVPDMAAIRKFNEEIRTGLAGNYSYLDLYSWVMSYGYRSDDGLHFSYATNRRIMDECIKRINRDME